MSCGYALNVLMVSCCDDTHFLVHIFFCFPPAKDVQPAPRFDFKKYVKNVHERNSQLLQNQLHRIEVLSNQMTYSLGGMVILFSDHPCSACSSSLSIIVLRLHSPIIVIVPFHYLSFVIFDHDICTNVNVSFALKNCRQYRFPLDSIIPPLDVSKVVVHTIVDLSNDF